MMQSQFTKLRGVVTGITYQKEEFTIARFQPEGELAPVTLVGTMPGLEAQSELLVQGQWTQHPKFGEQFKVESYAVELPRTPAGLIKYLSSGVLPGVKTGLAKRIVDRFGITTLDTLDHNIDKLTTIRGIGQKKLPGIKEA